MALINKSAGKRLYHRIADKWEIPRRMPKGFVAELEKLVETKLSTEANRRGCIKRVQQEFKFNSLSQMGKTATVSLRGSLAETPHAENKQ